MCARSHKQPLPSGSRLAWAPLNQAPSRLMAHRARPLAGLPCLLAGAYRVPARIGPRTISAMPPTCATACPSHPLPARRRRAFPPDSRGPLPPAVRAAPLVAPPVRQRGVPLAAQRAQAAPARPGQPAGCCGARPAGLGFLGRPRAGVRSRGPRVRRGPRVCCVA